VLALLLLLVGPAPAASLDAVEVGGPWGSPTTTQATATWWNPAGLAAGSGTRYFAEIAPTIGRIRWDRVDPYGYEGTDTMAAFAPVPNVGLATDLGVDGLGLGLSLQVPYARLARSTDPIPYVADYQGEIPVTRNVGRYSSRSGSIDTMTLAAGAGWDFGPVAVGTSGLLLLNRWTAVLDNTTLIDLDAQLREFGQNPDYTDAMIEDPRYGATLDFGNLRDTAFSFNAGVQVEPIEGKLALGLAYVHGAALDNKGPVAIHFSCPPQEDVAGRFGSEAFGLCDANLNARARVQYRLPSRLSLSARLRPTEAVQLELLGGWVGWSAFEDFDIAVFGVANNNDPDDFNDIERTAELVEQRRLWARANRNSVWIAADGKVAVSEALLVGGRVLFDQSAVPDEALMINNFDTNQLVLTALGSLRVHDRVDVGLTFSHYLLFARTIDNSGFGLTLDEEARKEDRWAYPQANGRYSGNIERIGLSVRGRFGGEAESAWLE
jgi:long-chain fatty acid transport protein